MCVHKFCFREATLGIGYKAQRQAPLAWQKRGLMGGSWLTEGRAVEGRLGPRRDNRQADRGLTCDDEAFIGSFDRVGRNTSAINQPMESIGNQEDAANPDARDVPEHCPIDNT